MAYASARQTSFSELPIIDISPIQSGEQGLHNVAREIYAASQEVGFFYVSGHGIDPDLREAALKAGQDFFALPEEEKLRIRINRRHRGYIPFGAARMYGKERPDLKESFRWAYEVPDDDPDVVAGSKLLGPNVWPEAKPEMQAVLYAYYQAVMACGHDIMRAMAVGLGLPDDFFGKHYTKPITRGSVLHYPPQPPDMGETQYGVAPHTDYGCLTLLWQDPVGGLQVQNAEGEWVMALPIDNTYVVNVGDLLQRWTNDRYVSNPHRVVNTSGKERYSMVVFFDPNADTVVDPASIPLEGGQKPKYEPITCENYIAMRMAEAFDYKD